MRFRHVLVVDELLDGFQLLRDAALLAAPGGGHVRLVSVGVAARRGGDGGGRAGVIARLEDRALLLRARGVHVTTGVLASVGTDDIVREARRAGSDIVLKRRRRCGRLEALLGREADRLLLRRCPCPVWIVDEDGSPDGPVLAALELHDLGSAGAALDDAVLQTAALLAAGLARSLHVVHAWYAPLMPTLARVAIDRGRNRRAILDAGAAAAARLDGCLARSTSRVPGPGVHLVRGDPSVVLPAIAGRTGAQVLVMSEVSRRGVGGAIWSSLAEHVLRDLRCSLLVIHPAVPRQRVRDASMVTVRAALTASGRRAHDGAR